MSTDNRAPDDQPVGELVPVEVSVIAVPEFTRAQYRQLVKTLGLPQRADGVGLLHCTDAAGNRYTLMTADVEYARMLRSTTTSSTKLPGVDLPARKFPMMRRGWPDDWAVSR